MQLVRWWLPIDFENSKIVYFVCTLRKILLLLYIVTGFYRVMYDEGLLSLIKSQLELDNSVISPLSRSQLLDDYFTFSWDGNDTNNKSILNQFI